MLAKEVRTISVRLFKVVIQVPNFIFLVLFKQVMISKQDPLWILISLPVIAERKVPIYFSLETTGHPMSKKGNVKRELLELSIPLFFGRNFFLALNAKQLKVLTGKILLDRFF